MEECPNMISVPNPPGLFIEFWKLAKAFKCEVLIRRSATASLFPWTLQWKDPTPSSDTATPSGPASAAAMQAQVAAGADVGDDHALTAVQLTSQYDAEATTHLLYACLPLIVGFAVYSLYHRAVRIIISDLMLAMSFTVALCLFVRLSSSTSPSTPGSWARL